MQWHTTLTKVPCTMANPACPDAPVVAVVLAGPLPQALQQEKKLWRGHEGPVYGNVGLAHVRKRLVEAVIEAPEQRQHVYSHDPQILRV